MGLKQTRMYVVLIAVVIVFSSVSGYLVAASRQPNHVSEGTTTEQQKTLLVTGLGWASAKPDLAKVNLGVTTQAMTANYTIQQNAEKMTQVIDALKGLGIADEDLKTQYFDLHPIYSKLDLFETPQKIVGYRVSNTIVADVHDLSIVGRVIDTAVEAGANQVQGVSFTLSDDGYKEMKMEALQEAAEDAKRKAETIANSLGVMIVGVLRVIEGGVWYQPDGVDVMEYGKAPETPIIPGDLNGSATVQVTYLIQ